MTCTGPALMKGLTLCCSASRLNPAPRLLFFFAYFFASSSLPLWPYLHTLALLSPAHLLPPPQLLSLLTTQILDLLLFSIFTLDFP